MIQLLLSNWTAASASIVSRAAFLSSADMFCGDINSVILSGYEKQHAIIIKDIDSEAVGGLSWNTGPETSICMKRPLSHALSR
jgi:hypothetical protein